MADSGERVAIRIVNSSADWFVPVAAMDPTVMDQLIRFYEEVREGAGELRRTLRGREGAGKVTVTETPWRAHFGTNQLSFRQVPADYRGGSAAIQGTTEIGLWYADQHGDAPADYVSFGERDHYTGLGGREVLLISPERRQSITQLLTDIPNEQRIVRPPNHELYVDDVVLTPEPEREKIKHPGQFVQWRFLTHKEQVVDTFLLYELMNDTYQTVRGPKAKAINYDRLPPLTPLQMHLVLDRMGYNSTKKRQRVLDMLVDCEFLGRSKSGFVPTQNGTTYWHGGRRHNFERDGTEEFYRTFPNLDPREVTLN
ncbi:hypothetical protein HOI26_00970 [Candidatus Woesearchaeota archaeon]|nr:hypothetical protein [Candidatus Woesearchaeota archaeon]